jgi:hypothetical protein
MGELVVVGLVIFFLQNKPTQRFEDIFTKWDHEGKGASIACMSMPLVVS